MGYKIYGGKGQWLAVGDLAVMCNRHTTPQTCHKKKITSRGTDEWAFTGRTPFEALERLKRHEENLRSQWHK